MHRRVVPGPDAKAPDQDTVLCRIQLPADTPFQPGRARRATGEVLRLGTAQRRMRVDRAVETNARTPARLRRGPRARHPGARRLPPDEPGTRHGTAPSLVAIRTIGS